jgi:hypothetical protein
MVPTSSVGSEAFTQGWIGEFARNRLVRIQLTKKRAKHNPGGG